MTAKHDAREAYFAHYAEILVERGKALGVDVTVDAHADLFVYHDYAVRDEVFKTNLFTLRKAQLGWNDEATANYRRSGRLFVAELLQGCVGMTWQSVVWQPHEWWVYVYAGNRIISYAPYRSFQDAWNAFVAVR